MTTTNSLDGDRGLAEGACLCRRLRRWSLFPLLGGIHCLDHEKDGKGNDQEVKNRVDEDAVIDGDRFCV